MKVYVTHVSIPAMSTIGYGEGYGLGECGRRFRVTFAGDHRPMRYLGEALAAASEAGENAPAIEVEDWQVLSVIDEEAQPLLN